jgi:hypothetical protein
VSIELGRRLIAAGVVDPTEIEAAFYRQIVAQIPFVRALLELAHITEDALEEALAAGMVPFLATIVPLPALVDEVPNQMCRRLMAVPVRRDPRTGLVDVAAVDPFDGHIPYEFSYHLKSEVRVLRGSLPAIEQALLRIDRGEYSSSVILRKSIRPPGYATPSVPPLRSDRPIPLVRKSKRGQSVDVQPVRNVAGPPEEGSADPPSSKVPPAPSMPTFVARSPGAPRERQKTAPGPPGVPVRQEPPVPAGYRGRPEVPAAVASVRIRPEKPSAAPASARGPSEEPGVAKGRPRPEKSGGPPPPPAVVPTPASARGGAKGRSEAPAQPSSAPRAPASVAAAPPKGPPPSPAADLYPRANASPGAPAPQAAKDRASTAPPRTTRGPFSPKVPTAPFADIRGVLAAMESATTRDEVIDCLIVGMSTVARRVGVFAIKKAFFRGVACNSNLGDAARFRAIEISSEATTVLGIAATSGSYLGPLPVTKPHADLFTFMKDASREVHASLIRVAGRPAVILFADGLGDTTIAIARAEELGHGASLAFSRIVTDAKAGRGRP